MKRTFLSFMILLCMCFPLVACNDDLTNEPQTETQHAQTNNEEHVHVFDCKDTSEKYLRSKADCTKAAVYYYSCVCGEKSSDTFISGNPTSHVYDQKNTDGKYLKVAATESDPAIYYYSCHCGVKGTKTFTIGSALSRWTDINKYVYGITKKASVHTITDDDKFFCGNVYIGERFNAIATDGTWYKIKYNCTSQDYAYIMCKYVTDNEKLIKFKDIRDLPVSGEIKDNAKGIFLNNGLIYDSGIFISRDIYDSSNLFIEAINEAESWIKVRYYGKVSSDTSLDGSEVYYCSLNNLNLLGY